MRTAVNLLALGDVSAFRLWKTGSVTKKPVLDLKAVTHQTLKDFRS